MPIMGIREVSRVRSLRPRREKYYHHEKSACPYLILTFPKHPPLFNLKKFNPKKKKNTHTKKNKNTKTKKQNKTATILFWLLAWRNSVVCLPVACESINGKFVLPSQIGRELQRRSVSTVRVLCLAVYCSICAHLFT